MQKITWILAVGLLTASCSGNGANSGVVPSMPMQSAHGGGLGTTRMSTASLTAPSGWSTTNTRALSLSGASDLGTLAASTQLTVVVGLQLRNAAQLQSALKAGQVLSRADIAAMADPTPDQVQQVESYLQSAGLTNVKATPDNLLVSATGTAAQMQKAFNTTLHSFSWNGKVAFGNVSPAYVPTSLGGVVVAVLGLNDVSAFSDKPKMATQATACEQGVTVPCVRFYDPATFQSAYDVGSLPPARNTSIAIMAEGNVSQAVADFRTNESQFHQPQVPLTVRQVGLASPDTAGNDEWTLDMTYSTAMAGNVKMLYVYATTSLTDSDIALEFDKWMTDDLAQVGNASFGECEAFPYVDGAMVLDDEILVQAAAQGQTLFASSGDWGGYCNVEGDTNGVPGGVPMVAYPSASPYVTSVGGTDLLTNADGSYQGEVAWEAGGGGLSQFEYAPYWEAEAQPVAGQGESFRGLPDVAMDAAIETGAELYTSGSAVNGSCTPCITGGTSLASPLAAGTYARLQSAKNNALGFGPIQFYNIYQQNPNASEDSTGLGAWELVGGFHDILTGTNGLYTALPRYDMTTGLGSFDVSKTAGAI
ncbi:MAG TPA: S53 family peptidase [Candidatus Dormibacteraeota bacterium]|nr:S53 family peptidase [Candidatus Dormibacteraeota bacterium]